MMRCKGTMEKTEEEIHGDVVIIYLGRKQQGDSWEIRRN
jgi:hypothetical protein